MKWLDSARARRRSAYRNQQVLLFSSRFVPRLAATLEAFMISGSH
jgi:hypothetical protein